MVSPVCYPNILAHAQHLHLEEPFISSIT